MCWANKCCFCFRLDVGCVLIGVGNLIFAILTAVGATYLLILEKDQQDHVLKSTLLQSIDVSKPILDITITLALVIGVVWILFSTLLIVGIRKNIPSLVLSYFMNGVIVTIICILGAIFELIGNLWIVSVVQTILSLINIHFLVVVHTTYELMRRGKIFGDNSPSLIDEEAFFDTDIDK